MRWTGERKQDELSRDVTLKGPSSQSLRQRKTRKNSFTTSTNKQPFLTLALCASVKMAMCQTVEKCNHYF